MNTEKIQSRLDFIDLAKGFCMILIIMFHTGFSGLSLNWAIPIALPFYYFVAGLFFKDYGGIKKSFKRKLNQLVIPAIFFTIVSSVVFYVGYIVTHKPLPLYGFNIFTSRSLWGGAVWFLFSLFWSYTFLFIITAYLKRPLLIFISILFLSILGFIFSR